MTALHKLTETPSLSSKISHTIDEFLSPAFDALKNNLEKILSSSMPGDFGHDELMLSHLVRDIGRQSLTLALSSYDRTEQRIRDEDGQLYRRVCKSKGHYQTLFGPIHIERHRYKACRSEEQSICPLELQSGIIEGAFTPNSGRCAMWLLSHVTPEETENCLSQFSGMSASRSSLDRLPKQIGKQFLPQSFEHHQQLLAEETIPAEAVSMGTSLDGVMVPMKGNKTLEKSDKRASYHWREASCGSVSFFDKEGERLSTIQYGAMPEEKKVLLKKLLQQHVEHARVQRPELKHIYIADGALDNWTFFDEQMPLADTQIVDFYHACEYLKAAFDEVYNLDKTKAIKQYEKYRLILRDDEQGVVIVLNHLRYLKREHSDASALLNACRYLQNNQHRMAYAIAKANNEPIGSGVIEACCKSLVQHRLKRTGMSWKNPGGQVILTFRV